MRARSDRRGTTYRRHRQRTRAGGEGGSRLGSGPLLPVSLSPFSGFICCSSPPAGKGNPLLLLSPGARWEPRVVFRFLYCGLTLPHIKNSSHGCRDTILLGGCQQLHLVACASSLGLCKPLLGAHPVVTPEEGVPYRTLTDLGRVKVVGRCSLCPLALVV